MRTAEEIAIELLKCAIAHEPDVCLVGNVTAAELGRVVAYQVQTCPNTMTTTTTKAAAWRRAADMLRRYVEERLPDDVDAHILAVIVPSLVRRAEIIERRRKVQP